LCSEASAALLPLVLEDALKVGFTKNQGLIDQFLKLVAQQIVPLPYKHWHTAIAAAQAIQKYGPEGGYVELDGQRITIRAAVHTLGGYSAHADQKDLLNFIGRMRHKPRQIRLVHGDAGAKEALRKLLSGLYPGMEVVVG